MSLPDIHSTLDFTLEPIRLEPVQPSEYEKLLYQAYEVSLAAVRNTDTATGPWVYNSTQEDIEIFTKKPAGSNTECSKGIGIIDAPPLLVSTLFNSPDWRPQWDGMHDRGERLDQMDQFTSVNYNSFKAPWPVSGRDFVAIGRSVILPPSKVPGLENETNMDIGAVFTFSIACESPKCPPKKGLVRGVLHFCGLWIEAIPGQPNRSKVIYTLGSDPMGSIPKSLVNAANVKQPLCIAAIRNVLAKNPKLRGEVEKKIETERQKSIKIREQKKGAESTATPSAPIAGSSSSSSIASATDPSSASASASATAAADADVEIDDANLPFPPSPYDAALAKAYDAAMSAIQSVGATDGWVFNSRQEEVDIFLKTTPGSTVNSCKGVGFIDADVETVDLVFNNNMYRNKWDEICEVSKEVKILDWSTSINYSAFAAPWPVSARDFIAVGRSVDEPLGKEKSAGVKFSWSISIDDDKLAPKKKGYIRGTLHFAGLWIEPVPGQPNRSKVIYTLSSDPNGSIPKAIVNGANIKQPLCIRTVGKFIQTSPDIVEKMRIQQRKEAEAAQQLKAEWKRKLAKKPSASSSSEESPALALSNLSSSLVLTSDAFNALTPESLPFDLVAELLKLSLHSTSGDLSQPYYVQWSKDRVFVPEHLDLLAEIEGRAVMASEEDHISPAGLATKLVAEIVKCAMGWTKHEPTVSLRPSLTSQADSPSAAPSPSAAAAAAAAAASVNNSTPPMGVLYFELIDLRQVVSTLQSAHLAAERLEKEKDKDGYFGSVFQQCFIHLELVGDPNPQGQVCHASIDLANPGALGSFTVAPTAVCFRVTNPNARLAVSLYTQKLDIIEFPSSGPGSGGNGGSGSLSRELTSQSVGGKLRNLVNPLALGGAVASGLESGFDSFLHVFDPSSKGTGATLEALNNAAKHPHPIVCVARASFDIMLDLGAPTKQHSRLQWRELEDGEGWNLAHPTTYDELLAKRSPARVNNSAIGNMVNGVIKKSSTNSNSVIGDAHPLLHVHSQTTHALLVHSYFVTTSKQDVLQAYLKHSLTPSFPSAHSSDYIILFQTLDGVFDLIRLNESQRDLAVVTYEKMQVGLSKAQAASVGASSRTSSKNAVTSHTPPVFVSKLLLSPTHHLLAATWFDLSRKRDLLAYARRLLRVELMTCLQSIDNDVLQPRRSAQATPIANPVPANLKSTTLHTNLHPLKQFGSTQFVVAYTACLQTLKSLLLIALAVCRILAWSDVYLSFFVLMTFLFLAFHPSFITIVLPLITIITLVRQAARAYFEQHLKHAQKSEEYERRKLKEKERFITSVSTLEDDISSSSGVSSTVASLLFIIQSLCVYSQAKARSVVEFIEWRNEIQTLSVIVFLVYTILISLFCPFEWTLVFLSLALAGHQLELCQALIRVQAAAIAFKKQQYYQTKRVHFPPSLVALQTMARQHTRK